MMTRKQFILRHGATCDNWTWSWSFVNHPEKIVIFGAWDVNTDETRQLILSATWEITSKGMKAAAYAQSREHIDLIANNGYRLLTFPMKHSEFNGRAKMSGFTPKLSEKKLVESSGAWYAVDENGSVPLTEEIREIATLTEGAKYSVVVNAYERSAAAREECLSHHGYDCSVCGFNFEVRYGEIGRQFIHVHHLVPIGSIGKEYQVDPIKDLIPVCPNCHAMIHRQKTNLSVGELKSIIRQNFH